MELHGLYIYTLGGVLYPPLRFGRSVIRRTVLSLAIRGALHLCFYLWRFDPQLACWRVGGKAWLGLNVQECVDHPVPRLKVTGGDISGTELVETRMKLMSPLLSRQFDTKTESH